MRLARAPLADLEAWQALLDRHAEDFAALVPGAALGVAPRYVTLSDGSLRTAVMPVVPPTEMLLWERRAGGTHARLGVYRGLKAPGVDVLFLAEDEALEAVLSRAQDDPFRELKRRLRAGQARIMYLHERTKLAALGYDELMDSLDLPFLGACR